MGTRHVQVGSWLRDLLGEHFPSRKGEREQKAVARWLSELIARVERASPRPPPPPPSLPAVVRFACAQCQQVQDLTIPPCHTGSSQVLTTCCRCASVNKLTLNAPAPVVIDPPPPPATSAEDCQQQQQRQGELQWRVSML